MHGLAFGIIFWLILGQIGVVILGLIGGSIYGLIGGLIGGLIYRLIGGFGDKIVLNEKILFNKIDNKNITTKLIGELIGGLILGLSLWPIIGRIKGLIYGMLLKLIFGRITGLIYGQPDLVIENKKNPNQGIWKSASNAVFVALIYGLAFGLILGLAFGPIMGLIYGLIFGQIYGLTFGGMVCIEHIALRLILYSNGYIPWNYARFLDYCTERLFLQRVGGRYRFVHKLLQDHFAQMEFRRD